MVAAGAIGVGDAAGVADRVGAGLTGVTSAGVGVGVVTGVMSVSGVVVADVVGEG